MTILLCVCAFKFPSIYRLQQHDSFKNAQRMASNRAAHQFDNLAQSTIESANLPIFVYIFSANRHALERI